MTASEWTPARKVQYEYNCRNMSLDQLGHEADCLIHESKGREIDDVLGEKLTIVHEFFRLRISRLVPVEEKP